MISRWIVILLLAVVPQLSLAGAAPHRIPLGSAKEGLLYWCGNQLSPPFVFTLELPTHAVFVNGLPLELPDTNATVPYDPGPYGTRKAQVLRRAIQVAGKLSRQGYREAATAPATLDVFRYATDVVDSVRVTCCGYTVYWKDGPEGFGISPGAPSAPTRAEIDSMTVAGDSMAVAQIGRHLEAGGVIIFKGGGLGDYVQADSHWAEGIKNWASMLRAGRDLDLPFPLSANPAIPRDQFVHPLSMSRFARRD